MHARQALCQLSYVPGPIPTEFQECLRQVMVQRQSLTSLKSSLHIHCYLTVMCGVQSTSY